MKIKGIIDEDFTNYKKPSMFIGTSKCNSFKCDKECGKPVCQNSELAKAPNIEIEHPSDLVHRFYNNPITEAVTIGGLEPFDTFDDLLLLVFLFQMGAFIEYKAYPDIIIYTGYYPEEIKDEIKELQEAVAPELMKVIIKFGRFIPDRPHKYDELLGIELASDNQFAKRLEDC